MTNNFIKKGAKVYAVFFTTDGELLKPYTIQEVYKNTVLFTNGSTHQKTYLRPMKKINLKLKVDDNVIIQKELNAAPVLAFPYTLYVAKTATIELSDEKGKRINFVRTNKILYQNDVITSYLAEMIILDREVLLPWDFYSQHCIENYALGWFYIEFSRLKLTKEMFTDLFQGFEVVGDEAKIGYITYDLEEKTVKYKNKPTFHAYTIADLVLVFKVIGAALLQFSQDIKIDQQGLGYGIRTKNFSYTPSVFYKP